MDWNPDFRKIGMDGLVLIVNGPHEARQAVRKLVKDGVEWVKTYPTGDAASPDINDHHTLCMTFEEMAAVVSTAHNHGLKVTGHCRATEGIKNALRAGYDAIEHGTFMDDEAMDLLLERDVPCVPALYFEYASIVRGPEFGLPPRVIDGHKETLEGGPRALAGSSRRAAGSAWGRLRLRLEPARRLRPRADVLRPARRLHTARNAPLRHAEWSGNPRPRPRDWNARTGQAGRCPDRRWRRCRGYLDPRRPPTIHRRPAGRHRQSGPARRDAGQLTSRSVALPLLVRRRRRGPPCHRPRIDSGTPKA